MTTGSKDTEQIINELISYQKSIEISPFVKTRIMNQVEEVSQIYERRMRCYLKLAYYCCFAVSILCSIYLGASLGESYANDQQSSAQEKALNFHLESGVENIESQFLLFSK